MSLDTNHKGTATRIAGIAVAVLAATLAHYLTPRELILWHNIFQRLYYLPIVYAALYFGWRGSILTAAASAVCFLPHIFLAWHHFPDYAMNQYAEIIVFFVVGSVTGVLADQERKRRRELQATTDQLQESFERLKRADRLSAIGQLAASLAHEIRNPLASIEGAVNILEQPATDEELRREFFGIVRKECSRLDHLLTNLLDFARPRRPEMQPLDLAAIIDSVIALVHHTAEQGGITLRKRVAGALPAVESDPEQLKQVLLNLTINAIQAMPEGGELELGAARKEGSVILTVRDQGIGVAELDKIFDPFFTTKEQGTGLGLSVAHQIVTQHGGSISAERNPGKGMTFSVVLPIEARSNA